MGLSVRAAVGGERAGFVSISFGALEGRTERRAVAELTILLGI